AFRAHRRALAGPAAADEERALEINEGLAEYTGYRLCGLPANVLPDRAAARLEDPPAGGLSRHLPHPSRPAHRPPLAAARPGRRARRTAPSDPGALLAGATGRRPAAGSALDRAKRYDGERLIAAEKAAEERRLARVAEHRRRFVDGPALRLPLTAA